MAMPPARSKRRFHSVRDSEFEIISMRRMRQRFKQIRDDFSEKTFASFGIHFSLKWDSCT